MEEFCDIFMKKILPTVYIIFIVIVIFTPFITNTDNRLKSLEKLHTDYVCLECNSLVKK